MITEDYCSFEVAKLLKEKGFNEECGTSYYISNKGCENVVCVGDFTKVRPWREALIAAPTHQLAAKWLREVHNIAIEPMLLSHGWFCQIEKILEDFCKEYINETDNYKSYEEAIEAALKCVLKTLI